MNSQVFTALENSSFILWEFSPELDWMRKWQKIGVCSILLDFKCVHVCNFEKINICFRYVLMETDKFQFRSIGWNIKPWLPYKGSTKFLYLDIAQFVIYLYFLYHSATQFPRNHWKGWAYVSSAIFNFLEGDWPW